jgi:hypothetical protein
MLIHYRPKKKGQRKAITVLTLRRASGPMVSDRSSIQKVLGSTPHTRLLQWPDYGLYGQGPDRLLMPTLRSSWCLKLKTHPPPPARNEIKNTWSYISTLQRFHGRHNSALATTNSL